MTTETVSVQQEHKLGFEPLGSVFGQSTIGVSVPVFFYAVEDTLCLNWQLRGEGERERSYRVEPHRTVRATLIEASTIAKPTEESQRDY